MPKKWLRFAKFALHLLGAALGRAREIDHQRWFSGE